MHRSGRLVRGPPLGHPPPVLWFPHAGPCRCAAADTRSPAHPI